jgi:hypothetical protein
MEIGKQYINLNGVNPSSTFASSAKWPTKTSKSEYQKKKYANPSLATPIIHPVQGKIDIPPLEGFPSPAIPIDADSIFQLGGNSK